MSIILAERIKANLATHHDFMKELGDFAAAQGWTVIDNLQNVQWADTGGGVFGFIAGSESYLEIESTGEFGNQLLHFRFRGEQENSVQDHEWVRFGAFKSGDTGKDTSSSINPVDRAANGASPWNINRKTSIKPTNIPRAFFFGNSYFIIAIVKLDSSFINFHTFGSPKLFDDNEPQGNFMGWLTTKLNDYWFNHPIKNSFDKPGELIYIEDQLKPSSEYSTNVRGEIDNVTITNGGFFVYSRILNVLNEFSDIRPLMSPTIFIKYDSDGRWRALGEYPILRVRSEGMEIGELVDYGGKKYRIFPHSVNGERVHGFAVRIA